MRNIEYQKKFGYSFENGRKNVSSVIIMRNDY